MAFGRAVVGQIESLLGDDSPLTCDAPAGRAALQRLKDRLTEGQGLRYDIDLAVFDHEMINAFAAPGGQIVIMRGLLDAAESPEEVAGVLAHEIGHVEARDPTRLAFRSAGSAGIIALQVLDLGRNDVGVAPVRQRAEGGARVPGVELTVQEWEVLSHDERYSIAAAALAWTLSLLRTLLWKEHR